MLSIYVRCKGDTKSIKLKIREMNIPIAVVGYATVEMNLDRFIKLYILAILVHPRLLLDHA